jgi:type I restriction enzyme M protein
MYENENDIDVKFIPSFLKKLGYQDEEYTTQYPVKVGRGRKKLDFIVSSNLNNVEDSVNLVIESKSPYENIDLYKEQAVSYGRLVKAKYSVLLNDKRIIIIENNSKDILYMGNISNAEEYGDLISRDSYFINENIVSYDKPLISEAKTVIKKFDEIEEFNRVFLECQNLIRDNDGFTGSDAFDELSNILFIKIYLEENNDSGKFTSEYLDNNGKDVLSEIIFPKVKDKYQEIFKGTETIQLSNNTVYKLVKLLEKHNLKDTNIDIKGRAYEILLGKTFTGSLGQHFTPRTIVDFMVSLLNPSLNLHSPTESSILDPSCGTGGFLIKCLEKYLIDAERFNLDKKLVEDIKRNTIYGIDLNQRAVKVTKMNMSLHGDGKGGIVFGNGLTYKFDHKAKYIISNPPFGIKIKDEKILKKYNTPYTKKGGARAELLFIEHAINTLKKEGVLCILLPDGTFNNQTTKFTRNLILENLNINAMISLPDKSFKASNANAVTSIMLAKKETSRDKYIFMSLADEVGFERTTQFAREIKQNDLIDIDKYYKNYNGNKSYYDTFEDDFIILNEEPAVFLMKRDVVTEKGRLDPNYFFAEYILPVIMSKKSGRKFVRLKKYCKVKKVLYGEIDALTPYVEYSSVIPAINTVICDNIISEEERPGRAKYKSFENGIICARMRDSETNIAILDDRDQILSNGFLILEAKRNINPIFLLYLLSREVNIQQVRLKATGTIMPTISEKEYMLNWIPEYNTEEIKEIIDDFTQVRKEVTDSISRYTSFMKKYNK